MDINRDFLLSTLLLYKFYSLVSQKQNSKTSLLEIIASMHTRTF